MSENASIPVIEEEAHVSKRALAIERVTVRTRVETEDAVLHDAVRREQVTVTHVPVEREVAEAPPIRTEGELTIIPVLEERVTLVKRLFVVEELHLRQTAATVPVELTATLRRTRVDVAREDLQPEIQ